MQKKTNAWGMMTLHAEDKETATSIFECLKTQLMQTKHKEYNFKFDETFHCFEEEKWYTLIAYFDGTGKVLLPSFLKNLGAYCAQDSVASTEEWEVKFEFNEDSKDYNSLCKETLYFGHRLGDEIEKLEPIEAFCQKFNRNAFTLSNFTEYTGNKIAKTLELGEKYRDSENYDKYREQCLREAVASHRIMSVKQMNVDESEKWILKSFPFLKKEENS